MSWIGLVEQDLVRLLGVRGDRVFVLLVLERAGAHGQGRGQRRGKLQVGLRKMHQDLYNRMS